MKELIVVMLFMVFCIGQIAAQFENSGQEITREYDTRSLGTGVGVEYGGILGLQYTHYFIPSLGVVTAGGVVKTGFSGGVGLKYRPWMLKQPKLITYYLVAMYSPVAGSTLFLNGIVEDRLFYGGHLGMGVEVRDQKWKRAFLRLAVHIVHDFGSFENYKSELKDRGFDLTENYGWYTFSLGYHYAF